MRRGFVKWRRKPGYRVEARNEWITIYNECDKGDSTNVGNRALTLAPLILPPREDMVVNAGFASESSETTSEHHCLRANHVEQKYKS